jgi:hypothetical protein
MAKIFLDRLTRMVDRATSGRIGDVTVECKHFFSGAAVYANGRICASLTPSGFAIKLPKESHDVLSKRRGVFGFDDLSSRLDDLAHSRARLLVPV